MQVLLALVDRLARQCLRHFREELLDANVLLGGDLEVAEAEAARVLLGLFAPHLP